MLDSGWSEGKGKRIDGLFYPKRERQIDRLGYETTKHALHFRGEGWGAVLSSKRELLTKNFVKDAAAATGEPEENVRDIRFIFSKKFLDIKCTVRHKAQTTVQEVQNMLKNGAWTNVKSLYPTKSTNHSAGHATSHASNPILQLSAGANTPSSTQKEKARRLARELSTYGRHNAGPDGTVDFSKTGKDMDEEPEDTSLTPHPSQVYPVAFT